MFFYHGTVEVIDDIDFNKSRLRTDFGRGFYLSSNLSTAKEWAIGKTGFSGVPTVMRYKINCGIFINNGLNILRFDEPSIDWLDFISGNRRRDVANNNPREPRHDYDIISGPIANDKVADVVDLYCKGRINAEEAIAKVKILPSVYQLSLHTSQTLKYIISVTYSQKENKKWNEWRNV